VPFGFLARAWLAALVAAAAARGLLHVAGHRGPFLLAVIVLALYGIVFFAATLALKLPEARSMLGMLGRRAGIG